MTPTMELRYHFHVTRYEWTGKWEPRGTRVLQQKYITEEGAEVWQEVPEVVTQDKKRTHYG